MQHASIRNLRLFTSGGSGNADMYVARGRYPSTTSYDAAPASGQWYYIMLKAKPSFNGVTISATYD